MQEYAFCSPERLDELLNELAQTGGRLIAGGTDVIPQLRGGRFRAARLIDLSRLGELRFIEQQNGTIRIGALTTYAEIIDSAVLQAEAAALIEAASVVGSPQTRHRGTLGGNIIPHTRWHYRPVCLPRIACRSQCALAR